MENLTANENNHYLMMWLTNQMETTMNEKYLLIVENDETYKDTKKYQVLKFRIEWLQSQLNVLYKLK